MVKEFVSFFWGLRIWNILLLACAGTCILLLVDSVRRSPFVLGRYAHPSRFAGPSYHACRERPCVLLASALSNDMDAIGGKPGRYQVRLPRFLLFYLRGGIYCAECASQPPCQPPERNVFICLLRVLANLYNNQTTYLGRLHLLHFFWWFTGPISFRAESSGSHVLTWLGLRACGTVD